MIRAFAFSLAVMVAASPLASAATKECAGGISGTRPVTAVPIPIPPAPSLQIPKVAAPKMQPTIRLPQPAEQKTAVTRLAPTSGGTDAEGTECVERRIPEGLRQKDR